MPSVLRFELGLLGLSCYRIYMRFLKWGQYMGAFKEFRKFIILNNFHYITLVDPSHF